MLAHPGRKNFFSKNARRGWNTLKEGTQYLPLLVKRPYMASRMPENCQRVSGTKKFR